MSDASRTARLAEYLGWLSRQGLDSREAERATRARDGLLAELSDPRISYHAAQTKIAYGKLSPGCQTCIDGTWSCVYVNQRCTANCSFCAQDRTSRTERPPTAEEIAFSGPDVYIDYLARFGFRGVGLSGGETFLAFDTTLSFVERIKERFGQSMYVWVYTNGDLVDPAKLADLRDAGLDEMRFNISARGYRLNAAELAREYLPTVTVEIPVLPQDSQALKACMLDMNDIGVDYLNIHQLVASRHNYQNLLNRGYTFLPPLAFHESPVLQSEMIALELLKHAAENDMMLSVHYCSHAYKAAFQQLARRRRGATEAVADFEHVTDAGYVRRFLVRSLPEYTQELTQVLREGGIPDNLWAQGKDGTELALDPSLIDYVQSEQQALIIGYSEAHVVSEGHLGARKLEEVKEIALDSGRKVYVGTKVVAEYDVSQDEADRFSDLFGGTDMERSTADAGMRDLARDPQKGTVRGGKEPDFEHWERIEGGFPAIPSSDRR